MDKYVPADGGAAPRIRARVVSRPVGDRSSVRPATFRPSRALWTEAPFAQRPSELRTPAAALPSGGGGRQRCGRSRLCRTPAATGRVTPRRLVAALIYAGPDRGLA